MRTPKLLVIDGFDGLGQQVERAVSVLRPRPGVVHCDSLEAVDEAFVEHGPFNVMIAGSATMTEPGLQRLRQLRAHFPSTSLVLADRRRNHSLRETVRTGALDILRLPVTDDVIVDAVEQALEMGRLTTNDEARTSTPHRTDGGVICVMSPSGGSGKTFLSINLAYYLECRLRRPSCLVDLDLQFGELSTALRLKPRYTITDVLERDEAKDGDLGDHLDEYLAVHETGVHVLAAPTEPAHADGVEGADVGTVIDAVRSRFDYAIVDTPAMLSEATVVAVERADVIFAMATLDLPSVRNLRVLLSTLEQLKVPSERIHLVLNKVEPEVGIDVVQVERYFPQGFSATIPYDRQVNRALNMGTPMLAYAPRSEVSRILGQALTQVLPPDAEKEQRKPEPPRRHLLGRFHRQPAARA